MRKLFCHLAGLAFLLLQALSHSFHTTPVHAGYYDSGMKLSGIDWT